MEELMKNKKTFLASGMFLHTGNMVFNSELVIKSEKTILNQL